MPLYEYRCTQCGEQFTRLRSIADRTLPCPCPSCRSEESELLISRVSAGDASCGAKSTGFT
ncbi:zinc ribbon domain-containing protein [Candidatus Fermentibacteria bacterium]|nr:zinc ribbon domain-containing protein [Candidatus Fermentibacteria bacterium]